MASIFDGFGALITGVFADVVSVTPYGGVAQEVEAAFREEPSAVLTEDGSEIMSVIPTLTAPASVIALLVPRGTVRPGNGKVYRAIDFVPTGSPDSDGRITIRLEWTGASS